MIDGPRPALRREVLLATGVLTGFAILVAAISVTLVLPMVSDGVQAFVIILALLVGDLAIVLVFLRFVLRSRLDEPVRRLLEGTERIAGGDTEYRLDEAESREIDAIRRSINSLAEELVRDQELLARNVASLERTNAELIAARDEVVRTARLASVGTLAAGIAHEIGNPLGALVGFTDLARMRADRADGEDGDTSLLVAIREEANRIDRIVRTLLEYARGGERGASRVDPGDVIDRVRRLLEAQGSMDGVEVAWPSEATGVEVLVEIQRFEQVLVNLLLNALDAMESQRHRCVEVGVSVAEGDLKLLPTRREADPPAADFRHRRRAEHELRLGVPDPVFHADRVVVVTVRDHGPGIPEDDLDRVFDPFFTTKDPGKGTGLGLAICDRLVDAMGGRLDVENHPEGGALFSIRLPLASAETDA